MFTTYEKDPKHVISTDDLSVVAATKEAICVEIEGEDYWIPNSHVHQDSEVFDKRDHNGPGKLIITKWIAEKKGLVE